MNVIQMLAATVNRATSDLWYLLHRALISPCVQPCRNKLFQLSDCLLDGFEFLQKLTKRFFCNSEVKVSLQMFVYSQTKDYLDWQRLKKINRDHKHRHRRCRRQVTTTTTLTTLTTYDRRVNDEIRQRTLSEHDSSELERKTDAGQAVPCLPRCPEV